jgi:hypothetical protein
MTIGLGTWVLLPSPLSGPSSGPAMKPSSDIDM